ncbi:MAG: spore germination protein [Thermoanaerobaculia bacterium]|jgi:spore germination protein YaaH|nr:spore germination protein [Thermoanaerobaculia bacterium]
MRIAAIAALLFSFAASTFAYQESAWIPPWDAAALKSIQSNLGALSESNPVWYSWNTDGTPLKNWNAENATWRSSMTGTLFVPTIQNLVNGKFDGNAAAAVFATPAAREVSAAAIAQLVVSQAFDGIDIDYERIPTASRDNFTAFLTTLGQKLRASNKKLSVTVYAKTSASDNWNGPGGEDWPAIGGIADSVKIMAYDYSYAGSAPGPIAPLDWIDRVATYAQSVIPSTKIMVALPWYGYDWSTGSTQSLTYASATQLALSSGATISHDVNGEATFTYSGHTVYFQDAASYAKKVQLLKDRHTAVAGFAAWSVGVEDPAIWDVMRGSGKSGATPLPTPPAAISIAGPGSLTVNRGSSVTADYRLVAINGFAGTAAVTVQQPGGFNGSLTADATSVGAGGSVRVTANTTSRTLPGTYQFQVTLTSGALTSSQVVTIQVNDVSRKHATK